MRTGARAHGRNWCDGQAPTPALCHSCSGATESSCALMQTRVKGPGMAWEPPGLRGVLCLRGLVLAKRWEAVWPSFSANSRISVEAA